MPTLSAVRLDNANVRHAYIPTMVVVGGTSGIGQAIAETFASLTKGNANIIIVGRNKAAAESSIARFPKPSSSSSVHEFIRCDMTSIKQVQALTSALASRFNKINYLVLSCGVLTINEREETADEGIDKVMAVRYYARWKVIYDLEPLLRKARDEGEAASVLSILAAGKGGGVILDDLELKRNYGFRNALRTMPAYNDAMIESFSERNPGVHFCHIWPGQVDTPIFDGMLSHWLLWWFRLPIKLLIWLFFMTPETCAQFMLWALFNNDKGASRRKENGEEIGSEGDYGSGEVRQKIWEHTVEVMDRVSAKTKSS